MHTYACRSETINTNIRQKKQTPEAVTRDGPVTGAGKPVVEAFLLYKVGYPRSLLIVCD